MESSECGSIVWCCCVHSSTTESGSIWLLAEHAKNLEKFELPKYILYFHLQMKGFCEVRTESSFAWLQVSFWW
jgi:hypothetical protein